MLDIVIIPLMLFAMFFLYGAYKVLRWWFRREGEDLAEW